MNSESKRFIGYSVIAAVVVLAIIFVLHLSGTIQSTIMPAFYVVPLVCFITVLFHTFIIRSAKSADNTFISKYIASSGLKLIIYLTGILIYIFAVGLYVKFVMVVFLISYVIFSFLEVYSVLRYLKK